MPWVATFFRGGEKSEAQKERQREKIATNKADKKEAETQDQRDNDALAEALKHKQEEAKTKAAKEQAGTQATTQAKFPAGKLKAGIVAKDKDKADPKAANASTHEDGLLIVDHGSVQQKHQNAVTASTSGVAIMDKDTSGLKNTSWQERQARWRYWFNPTLRKLSQWVKVCSPT